MQKKLLMSSCLLGQKVRYDGTDNLQTHERLQNFVKAGKVIAICPEMAGGLATPRPAAQIQGLNTGIGVLNGESKVITIEGDDVTAAYIAGAQKAFALAQKNNVGVAILKARSPSCGSQQVYDGTFSRTLIVGMGVTAALLSQHNILVFDETQIDEALDALEML